MLTLMLAGIALGAAAAPLLARLPIAWLAAASAAAVTLGYWLAAPAAGAPPVAGDAAIAQVRPCR